MIPQRGPPILPSRGRIICRSKSPPSQTSRTTTKTTWRSAATAGPRGGTAASAGGPATAAGIAPGAGAGTATATATAGASGARRCRFACRGGRRLCTWAPLLRLAVSLYWLVVVLLGLASGLFGWREWLAVGCCLVRGRSRSRSTSRMVYYSWWCKSELLAGFEYGTPNLGLRAVCVFLSSVHKVFKSRKGRMQGERRLGSVYKEETLSSARFGGGSSAC